MSAAIGAEDYTGKSGHDNVAQTVSRLARQLDAQRLADRQQAETELLRLGPRVIDLLPQPGPRSSAEMRQRLMRIRRKLQEQMSQAAAAASTVTLHGENVRLSEFLAAVERQTGNKIIDLRKKFGQQQTDPHLTIDLDAVPFWQALDTVFEQAGMEVYPYAMRPAVGFVARAVGDAKRRNRAAYSGPLRIEPLSVIATRGFRDSDNSMLQVKVQLSWEPRLSPISLIQKSVDLKAIDGNGHLLRANKFGGEQEAQVDRNDIAVEMLLPFDLPARNVKQIASIDGAIDAILPGKTATFRFDKLTESKNIAKRIGGVTVTFEGARRSGRVWEIAVSVRFDDAGDALESHRGWIFDNEAYLETPDGKRIENDGFETTLQTEDQVGLVYLFNLDSPPERMTFVYKTATSIISKRFEYRLKNIPLP